MTNSRLLFACVLVALVAGCGSHGGPGLQSTTTTTNDPLQSTHASAPSVTESPKADSGIVIETLGELRTDIILGVVDPTNGTYSDFKEFDVSLDTAPVTLEGSWSSAPKLDLSPDFSKYATTTRVDGRMHAGWVDDEGVITTVTKDTGDPGPFGGNPYKYEPIGFDGNGYFYYSANNGSAQLEIYKVGTAPRLVDS